MGILLSPKVLISCCKFSQIFSHLMKFTLDQLLCSFSLVNWAVKQHFVPPATGGPQIDDSEANCASKEPGAQCWMLCHFQMKLPGAVALQSLCVAHCSQSNKEGAHPILPFQQLRTLVGREVESVFWRYQTCFAENTYNYCPKDLIKLRSLCFFTCALKSWVQVTLRSADCR